MQDMMGLGLFSVATGSLMFDKCAEYNGISDVVSLIAWILLPLLTIFHLFAEQNVTALAVILVVLSLFVVSFYAAFMRDRIS